MVGRSKVLFPLARVFARARYRFCVLKTDIHFAYYMSAYIKRAYRFSVGAASAGIAIWFIITACSHFLRNILRILLSLT